MFGLAPFAGAPFSSVLQFTDVVPVTGLVATTVLGNPSVSTGSTIPLTGVQADTAIGSINARKDPVMWTSVITVQ
jgi:hypothetical protein